MRKICLFIIALLLSFSCSKDGDGVGNDTFFSPPTWIQGEWVLISSQSYSLPNGMEFTKDDFITIYNNPDGIYRESQNWFFGVGTRTLPPPNEQFSTNNYVIICHYVMTDNIYDFTYISDSEIRGSRKDTKYGGFVEFTLTRK